MVGDKIYWEDFFKDQTIWQKIVSYFKMWGYRISNFRYDLIYGIKSYWKWKNVIWRDRPWGYSELIKIMIFKLRMDAAAFEKNDYLETSQEKASQMREVADLLQKFQDDPYTWSAHRKHKEIWGEDKMYFIEREDGNYEMKDDRDDLLTPEQSEQERADYKRLMDAALKEKADDLHKAMQIMEENMERWWD